ncbi:MAG: hypothetical protein J6X94_07275 [Lachnospiraceae bacterium]|nr:hypothetical protein [Lachnospiraceae bacterium]
MELFYWILEYCKVNIAYMMLMFVWPSIVFYKFLKGRSFSFRFMFCCVSSVISYNLTVMILGLLHILSIPMFNLLFYGSVVVSLISRIPDKRGKVREFGRVLAGSYGVKQLFYNLFRNTINTYHRNRRELSEKLRGHKIEYALLSIVLIFGMIYFTYGTIQNHSFGFGDMYVHSSWIYGLVDGKIFSSGIYPEGMHCFIYAMHVAFGISLFSSVLYTGPVHSLIIMVSVYIFLRRMFRSRFTPIFSLALFLTLDVLCIDEVYGMSRFQWTIPMEFGLSYAFICVTALFEYLEEGGKEGGFPVLFKRKKKRSALSEKLIYNDKLIIFIGALICTIISHFYATGMAFFLCLSICPFMLHKLLNYKRFIPIFASILVVLFVAITPMALAYASGIEFEKSIGWAVSVIEGEEKDADENGNMVSVGQNQNSGYEQAEDPSQESSQEHAEDYSSEEVENTPGNETEESGAVYEPVKVSLTDRIRSFARTFINAGYETLYLKDRGSVVIGFTVLAFALFAICKAANIIYVLVRKSDDVNMRLFDGYFVLAFASVLFMLLYSSYALNLPSLFSPSRLCGIERFLLCAVCFIPVDIIFMLFEKYMAGAVVSILSIVVIAGIYIGCKGTGNFRGYLYCEFTRYNSVVNVTESIVANMDPKTFTIVSPVDDLYHSIEYGFHEELVQFANDCVEKDYTLPTEYVFIFYEKRPLKYAQFNFFMGPSWIAEDKYCDFYDTDLGSRYPNYIRSTASPEIAVGPFYKFPVSSKSYKDWLTRTVLESRMLKWVDDFNNLYPNELHVYYEDENFICYYFRQNPACLYQLGFEIDDSRLRTEDAISGTAKDE